MDGFKIWVARLYFFLIVVLVSSLVFSQDTRQQDSKYQIGTDERLLITVHVFGEVQNPGEYLVPDNTNVLELISKAGGPTEYSNLKNVKITRGLSGTSNLKSSNEKTTSYRKQVIKVNLKKILNDVNATANLPTLQPDDVIRVGRNSLFTWQRVIRTLSELAIIAQLWYWYNRTD